jgi:hypothetical protein
MFVGTGTVRFCAVSVETLRQWTADVGNTVLIVRDCDSPCHFQLNNRGMAYAYVQGEEDDVCL